MRKWNLSLTYEPKIQPVREGIIRQTIREVRKAGRKQIGDLISLHGWEGKPYWSSWSWRMNYTEIKEVFDIDIGIRGIMTYNYDGYPMKFFRWDQLGWLATLDGIVPPTGDALRDVLIDMNKISKSDSIEAQIIRW